MAVTNARIVISDYGQATCVSAYTNAMRLTVEVSPLQAVRLAQQLLAAALPKLRPDITTTNPDGG